MVVFLYFILWGHSWHIWLVYEAWDLNETVHVLVMKSSCQGPGGQNFKIILVRFPQAVLERLCKLESVLIFYFTYESSPSVRYLFPSTFRERATCLLCDPISDLLQRRSSSMLVLRISPETSQESKFLREVAAFRSELVSPCCFWHGKQVVWLAINTSITLWLWRVPEFGWYSL